MLADSVGVPYTKAHLPTTLMQRYLKGYVAPLKQEIISKKDDLVVKIRKIKKMDESV